MPSCNSHRSFWPWIGILFILVFLLQCEGGPEPIVLQDDPVEEGEGIPDGGDPGSEIEGCLLQFQAQIQLKASANPPGASGPFEILDAEPFPIGKPIPIIVDGNRLTLEGDSFPDIFFRPDETPADIKIKAVPGSRSTGVYDPASGEIQFEDFAFSVEIVQKGSDQVFIPGEKALPLVDMSTGTHTANGNLNSISDTGQPLNSEDRTLVMVAGMTLPNDFAPLTPLNTIIGGGALIARFEGVLDQLPQDCEEGKGGFAETEILPGIQLKIENQIAVDKIDFGNSDVVLKRISERLELDCSKAEFRQLLRRRVTLTNTGSETRNLRLKQPKDRDGELSSPLCGSAREFHRGPVLTKGQAQCDTFQVGGKKFSGGDCELPAGVNNSISFNLWYLPFNYQEPGPEGEPVVDRGVFTIETGNGEAYSLALLGRSIPAVGDVFSIAKVGEGESLGKKITNEGLLKIPLADLKAAPFTQELLLINDGPDDWEIVGMELEKEAHFSVTLPSQSQLPHAEEASSGVLPFSLVFEPGLLNLYRDHLTIRLLQPGSVSPANPDGIRARVEIDLLGTVGIPPITGKWKLHFDFFTAMIDHVALSAPIESNDFRQRPDLAVAPLNLEFKDTETIGIQHVVLNFKNIDIMDPSLTPEDRKKVLRIFTARASRHKDGQPFAPGDNVDQCDEPQNINQPYQSGNCSYFYWTLQNSETGYYDDETGHLTLPSLKMRMLNPYHADIFGIWPESNPFTNPDYILDVPLEISFTTHLLDQRILEEGEAPPLLLVPDERILESELDVHDKRLGKDCPEGYLEGVHPRLKCYLSSDDKFLEGRVASLRPSYNNQYLVNLVGVTHLPPGTTDPDIPWFLGDDGGSLLYIAIQGRLCPEDSPCLFEPLE